MLDPNRPVHEQPVELLRDLIRFDTTNPPGNERACISYIDELLRSAGLETTMVGPEPQRQSLVTRLKGAGRAPGLMLYGHLDVVTTEGQPWTHPPFEAVVEDGFIWGRGALDMKGSVAMMLSAFLRYAAEGHRPPGDVVFAALADEENTGRHGGRYLIDEHADLFSGVRYALGELGGFPLHIFGEKFYGIQVAEKHVCRWDVTLRGPAGHASQPIRGGAMAKLSRVLHLLDSQRLPVHISPVVRRFFEIIAERVPDKRDLIHRLLDPEQTDAALDELGADGLMFNAMLHNTVSPTMVQGGHMVNVIPSEITLCLDGRALPGYDGDDVRRELRGLLGGDVELTLTRYSPGPAEPDMGLYETLAQVLRRADPEGVPIPWLMPATTDARFFSELGIQSYGYTPMNLPPEIDVLRMAHNADERIPVESVRFGAEAIYQVLRRGTA